MDGFISNEFLGNKSELKKLGPVGPLSPVGDSTGGRMD